MVPVYIFCFKIKNNHLPCLDQCEGKPGKCPQFCGQSGYCCKYQVDANGNAILENGSSTIYIDTICHVTKFIFTWCGKKQKKCVNSKSRVTSHHTRYWVSRFQFSNTALRACQHKITIQISSHQVSNFKIPIFKHGDLLCSATTFWSNFWSSFWSILW